MILINCLDWESPPDKLRNPWKCWSRAAEQGRHLSVKYSAAIREKLVPLAMHTGVKYASHLFYSGSNGGLQSEKPSQH